MIVNPISLIETILPIIMPATTSFPLSGTTMDISKASSSQHRISIKWSSEYKFELKSVDSLDLRESFESGDVTELSIAKDCTPVEFVLSTPNQEMDVSSITRSRKKPFLDS